ncbi:uncharacterized protein LOC119898282 [Micropterus salmoides]|uniref:uncharacterized protein LOC119898282 n=1 Tax=Micropterus salmoides TaxID=27706 RepID=UPI0018ECE3E1|nr:uncharacterized protein LOC119898282 [Micropterus salmoides]
MAFLCSKLQVAVETQSQTEPRWHTECRERRMLLPPSGDMAAAPASHQPHHSQYIYPGFRLHPRSIVAALDLVHSPPPPSSASRLSLSLSLSRSRSLARSLACLLLLLSPPPRRPPASPLAPRLDPSLRALSYPFASLPQASSLGALRSSSFSVPRVLVCLSPSFHPPSPRTSFSSRNLIFYPQRCVWHHKKMCLQLGPSWLLVSVHLQGPWEAVRLKTEIKEKTEDQHLGAEQRCVYIER